MLILCCCTSLLPTIQTNSWLFTCSLCCDRKPSSCLHVSSWLPLNCAMALAPSLFYFLRQINTSFHCQKKHAKATGMWFPRKFCQIFLRCVPFYPGFITILDTDDAPYSCVLVQVGGNWLVSCGGHLDSLWDLHPASKVTSNHALMYYFMMFNFKRLMIFWMLYVTPTHQCYVVI